MKKNTYQSLKKHIYKYYNKKKKENIEESVQKLATMYGIKINMNKILEMYGALTLKNVRTYIIVSCLVYLYLRHFDPLAVKLSDFKIVSNQILQDIRKQLIDKKIIEPDYDKEVQRLVTSYLEKTKLIIYKDECLGVYSKIKQYHLVRGYTSRVISASVCLYVLNKHDDKFKVADLFKFFRSTDVSVYSFKKLIESIEKKSNHIEVIDRLSIPKEEEKDLKDANIP